MGATVLVAEDEPVVRRFVCKILESDGHRVLVATDGQDALEKSRSFDGEIDLLITDVVMPRMDGAALAEAISRERPATRILYMSGYSCDSLASLLRGDKPYLRKPFPIAALRAHIDALLNGSEQAVIY